MVHKGEHKANGMKEQLHEPWERVKGATSSQEGKDSFPSRSLSIFRTALRSAVAGRSYPKNQRITDKPAADPNRLPPGMTVSPLSLVPKAEGGIGSILNINLN